ncbi:PCL7 [Candida jiufengensis]|uniref:PCL7 n=1 Tax=Candida jiufengensis TaxID=497108 RepID=UPI0022252716|nr:PCL7 [Candida jiufengensis]KAI5951680.1 PCL7 [Candida jiufengensis]
MTSNFNNNESYTTIDTKPSSNLINNNNMNDPNLSSSIQFQNNTNGDNSFNKPQVSNLTKTLLSSNTSSSSNHNTNNSTSNTDNNNADNNNDTLTNLNTTTTDYISGIHYDDNSNNHQQNQSSNQKYNGSFPQQIPNSQNSFNYIPSSHNTPTVVGTSYTSNLSYNASLPSTNNFISQPIPTTNSSFQDNNHNNHQNQLHGIHPPSSLTSSGFKPNSLTQHALPTTNVYTDTVTSSSSSLNNRSSLPNFPKFTPSSLNQPPPQQQQQQSSFSIPNNYQPPIVYHPTQFGSSSLQHTYQQRIPSSLPTNPSINQQSSFIDNSQQQPPQPSQPSQQPQYVNRLQQILSHDKQPNSLPTSGSIPIPQSGGNTFSQPQSQPQSQPLAQPSTAQENHKSHKHQQQQPYVQPEPDHYLTYNEFLQELNKKDQLENGTNFEEHLNIVDFPVNDLIIMLSCLLTKIIEANDKLHPNHFENTIAIRQKIKEEKKMKKLHKSKNQNEFNQGFIIDQHHHNKNENSMDEDIIAKENYKIDEDEIEEDYDEENHDNNEEDDDDEEDDEMKNKYLANVLAFHGTNVPGISLQAYLARVLKYCPVTNEVFLSLLVYFDRIAKKANNLNQKRKHQPPQTPDTSTTTSSSTSSEAEQLFVMDSYNIHRLIISGITVSSKFFSDIFYKNLRYAKVGGLPLEELNYLELQFLLLLDFKLMISVEDLQNYGDLLSRFWKREQQQQQQSQNHDSIAQSQLNQPSGGNGNGDDQSIHQTSEVKG